MLPKKHDAGLSIFFISSGIAILLLSYTVKSRTVLTIGPGFLPRIIGVMIMILGAALLFQTMKRTETDSSQLAEKDSVEEPFSYTRKAKITLIGTFISLVLYVSMMEILGFPITTAAYLSVQLCLLTEKINLRTFLVFTASAIAGSVVITLVFTKLLGLYLPLGILG
jgi:putative tricarboxylic transport membrane protein